MKIITVEEYKQMLVNAKQVPYRNFLKLTDEELDAIVLEEINKKYSDRILQLQINDTYNYLYTLIQKVKEGFSKTTLMYKYDKNEELNPWEIFVDIKYKYKNREHVSVAFCDKLIKDTITYKDSEMQVDAYYSPLLIDKILKKDYKFEPKVNFDVWYKESSDFILYFECSKERLDELEELILNYKENKKSKVRNLK